MPEPRRILITGSRDWTDRDRVYRAIVKYWDDHASDNDITIVEGGAAGADSLARQIGHDLGFRIETHPYPPGTGRRGGYIRNQEMVAAGANICLAFIKDNSRGASMCAALAEKAGIPVVYYREGGEDA